MKNTTNQPTSRRLRIYVACLCTAIGVYWLINRDDTSAAPPVPATKAAPISSQDISGSSDKDRLAKQKALDMAARKAEQKALDMAARKAEQKAAWGKVQVHLTWARKARVNAAIKSVSELHRFFDQARKSSRPFAEEMFTLGSKWEYVSSSKLEYQQYLRRQFSHFIFSPKQLETAIESSVVHCIQEYNKINNQLLVKIRHDLANYKHLSISTIKSTQMFKEHIDKLANESTVTTKNELALDVGGFVASEVAAVIAVRLLSSMATRMGISTAILGGGTLGAGASFGATIVAGLVLDYCVQSVIGWFWDAEGNLTTTIRMTLNEVEREIILGSLKAPGMRAIFAKWQENSDARLRSGIKAAIYQTDY
jgi:hypothetical protein